LDLVFAWWQHLLHWIVPQYEGMPDGPCPQKASNWSVKLSQGDLMLCCRCEATATIEHQMEALHSEIQMQKATILALQKQLNIASSLLGITEADTPLSLDDKLVLAYLWKQIVHLLTDGKVVLYKSILI
jgi:hypothetical protein